MPSILIEDLLSRIDHRSYRERKYVLPPNVDHHARQSTSVDPILRPNWRRPVNTTAQTREEGPILDEHSSPPEHRATHAMDRDETTTTMLEGSYALSVLALSSTLPDKLCLLYFDLFLIRKSCSVHSCLSFLVVCRFSSSVVSHHLILASPLTLSP